MFLSVCFCSIYSLKTANFRELGCPYTPEAISSIVSETEMAKSINFQILPFSDIRYGKKILLFELFLAQFCQRLESGHVVIGELLW